MKRLKTPIFKYISNGLMGLVIVAFLAACGGGGLGLNPDPVVKKAIDVTSVNVQRFVESNNDKEDKISLQYGRKVTVTINGNNLDAEPLTVRFPGCSGLEESADGTGEKRVYTCTLKSLSLIHIWGRNCL